MNIQITPLVSVDEARRLLGGRGRGHVYQLIREGSLSSVMDGGRRLIIGESLLAHVASLVNGSRQDGYKADAGKSSEQV